MDAFFKQYFWTVQLVALGAAAWLGSRVATAFIENSLSPSPAELQELAQHLQRPAARTEPEDSAATAAFLERNLFGAAREDLKPAGTTEGEIEGAREVFNPDQCEPTSLGANLVATLVSSVPEASVAVFIDPSDDKPVALREGEQVLASAEIVHIDWGEVSVRHNGRCERFLLEDGAKRVSAAPISAPKLPTKDGLGENVKKVSDSEFEIPREEIDKALTNMSMLATQARIVPSFKNGKPNGFKLFSIRSNSLYSKIGIKNGDVVQRINGFEMNSPDKALQIYNKLKNASSITVDLLRRGRKKSINYTIR